MRMWLGAWPRSVPHHLSGCRDSTEVADQPLHLHGGGDPFGATTITNIFPNPAEGSAVDKWNNFTTNYDISNFSFGQWDTNFTIGEVVGFVHPDYIHSRLPPTASEP